MSFPGSEIYSSGAIVVRDRQPLTLEINPLDSPLNERYEVRLRFSTIEGQEGGVKWEHSANGGLDLDIINFDSPLGVTTHTPINVGSYQEREILLDFVVYALGEPTAPKLFCYTLRSGP
jgi:hypothetical protein